LTFGNDGILPKRIFEKLWGKQEMPNEKTKLLIVDDDSTLRHSLTEIFAACGNNVETAEDGFSALMQMRRQVPDILLSDLNMPGMSGFELLSVVRRRFPRVWVIAMSSAFSGDGIPVGIAADNYYEKGARIGGLLETVAEMSRPGNRGAKRAGNAVLPIWVPKNGHDEAGRAYITIYCPECLRTFPQMLGDQIGEIHEADCIYCKSLTRYAIVKPVGGHAIGAAGDGVRKRMGEREREPERQAR
jgi:CheY-like chemotaxis protein